MTRHARIESDPLIAEEFPLLAAAASVIMTRIVPDHGMPPVLTRLSHLDPFVERSDYPDDVIDQVAFNGPPERIVEMLRALAELGLDEVAPCYLNGRLDEMDVVGREIIPAVAAIAA